MTDRSPASPSPEPRFPEPPGLGWRRGLARLVLWFERLLPALAPAAWVVGLFVCAALLDLPPLLPWWAHGGLLVASLLAVATLLWRGLARLRAPDAGEADRRLERDSGLSHRPLAALTDRPVHGDPISLALWRAHVARGLARVRRLRLDWPRPGLAALDRRALRYAVLLGLIATLVIAGPDAPGRLMAAVSPGLPRPPAARPVEVQAWITPPAYTGLAPLFLTHDQPAVSVPAGARLTANVTGGASVPDLLLDGGRTPFNTLDQTSFQTEQPLGRNGRVAIARDGHDIAGWDVTVIPDQPPVARWTDPPGMSESGLRTRLPWTVSDDYGVVTLRAELRLAARPEAPPLEIAVSLPGGNPKSAHSVHQHDLIAHPWAGLGVTARLVARDGAGQTGTSEDARFDLPERVFQNPIAKALIAQRKGLSLHPEDRTEALETLDGLMQNPEAFGADSGAFLNLSALYYLLVRHGEADAIPEAQERMWNLALHLEEGQTEETARALEAARQAARDAMEQVRRDPTDANHQALEQKLNELREAVERHMRALMEEAERNNEALPFDPKAEQLTNEEMERLAEEAKQAAREGRMEDARQKMEELERLLERLKEARAEKGQGNSQQRQKGRDQMGAVQDMAAREGELLDHAESRAEQAGRPRRVLPNPTPGDTNPADANPAVQRPQDQRVQQALRRSLGELMQQFGDLTGEVPPALTEADQAMRESGQQLGRGDDEGGGKSQRRAIEALQKGAREMGQALARQFGPGQPGGEWGEGDSFGAMGPPQPGQRGMRQGGGPLPAPPNRADSRGRDPLGRTNQGNSLDSGDVHVPEEAERQRARAIQEELRRRGAERERPRRELDYIDRLLRQF